MINTLLKIVVLLYVLVNGYLLQQNYLTPFRPMLTVRATYNLTCDLHAFNSFIKANYTSADIVFAKNSDRIPTNSSDIFIINPETVKLQIHAPMTVNTTSGQGDHYHCYVYDNGHLSHIVGHSIVDYTPMPDPHISVRT